VVSIMRLSFSLATEADAAALVELQNAAATHLTRTYGAGHWSHLATENGVLRSIRMSRVLTARRRGRIVGSLRLATKKPWAIDRAFFTDVRRPLYLLDMVVTPPLQRQGVGRQLVLAAEKLAREWPADAICLDAYDSDAGAGAFYAKCGFQEVGRKTYRGVPLVYFELLLG
jgi:GNAT superfamily N-acetyltransferase